MSERHPGDTGRSAVAVTDEAIGEDQGHDRLRRAAARRPASQGESELAAGLGLSRNSLREAVRALSLIRILDVGQGDGTLRQQPRIRSLCWRPSVSSSTSTATTRCWSSSPCAASWSWAATAMAASRITDRVLDELEGGAGRPPAPSRRWSELVDRDLEFHRGIVGALGQLGALLPPWTVRPGPPPGPASGAGSPRRTRSAAPLYEHRAILGALRDRDAGGGARSLGDGAHRVRGTVAALHPLTQPRSGPWRRVFRLPGTGQ